MAELCWVDGWKSKVKGLWKWKWKWNWKNSGPLDHFRIEDQNFEGCWSISQLLFIGFGKRVGIFVTYCFSFSWCVQCLPYILWCRRYINVLQFVKWGWIHYVTKNEDVLRKANNLISFFDVEEHNKKSFEYLTIFVFLL